MPNWITVTIDDLNDARAAELVDALRTEALADGQTDPMPRIVQNVTDEIRRCIGFWPQTPVDVDATKIPTSMKQLATGKIVRVMKGRLLQALTDDEKTEESLYQKRLEQLTRGEWPVDKPDVAQATPTVEHSGASQVISSSRPICRDDFRGL